MKKRMRIRKGKKERGSKMHRGWEEEKNEMQRGQEEEKERIIEKKGRNVTEREIMKGNESLRDRDRERERG